MIVSRDTFYTAIEKINQYQAIAVDTETTGLLWFKEDKIFSFIAATKDEAFYFNFLKYDDEINCPSEHVLPREAIKDLQLIFNDPTKLVYLHNAKFDMAMLAKEGVFINCTVHCTMAIARVEYNAHFGKEPYGLAACSERIGLKKDDAVEEYISKHHKWEWEKIPGRAQKSKLKHFDLVPFEIIAPYGCQDAFVTRMLGEHQVEEITKFSNTLPTNIPGPLKVMHNERRFTKTCFNIEQTGVLIDKEFCKEAAAHETKVMEESAREFFQLTGKPFINSSKELAPVFEALGETFPKTALGNNSFTKDVLDTFKSPAAQSAKAYRKAEKRAAYFYSYLYYADRFGVVHANIKQSGTEHGRVSYGNPNFQNVPKRGEDKSPYPVRRAIIPRPGYFLAMPDYDQMEYKMMIDYANEPELIKMILNGHDVHQACSDLMEIGDREPAKTMNFLKLYGGGSQKLADSLNIPLSKANEYSQLYWQKLPNVAKFINQVSDTAKKRGYVINWFGRRCNFPNSQFAYAAPNHLISGGCADVVKIAMNQIDDFLKNFKSRMLIQVHDEIVFEIHESEVGILPTIKEIMEKAYPYKHLPLTCAIDHSFKSWFDKVEGIPS